MTLPPSTRPSFQSRLGWCWRAILARLNSEAGLTIVEELISTTVIAVVAVTTLVGLSTISLGSAGQSERTAAEALLVAQAEAIKAASYGGGYGTVVAPAGYSVTLEGPRVVAPGLQSITITVGHGGRELRSLTVLKGDR